MYLNSSHTPNPNVQNTYTNKMSYYSTSTQPIQESGVQNGQPFTTSWNIRQNVTEEIQEVYNTTTQSWVNTCSPTGSTQHYCILTIEAYYYPTIPVNLAMNIYVNGQQASIQYNQAGQGTYLVQGYQVQAGQKYTVISCPSNITTTSDSKCTVPTIIQT